MRFIYSKTFVYFAMILTVTLLLIFLHLKGWLNPVQSSAVQAPRPFVYVLKKTGSSIKSFFSLFSSVSELNKSNALLADQVRLLRQENATLQQFKLENEILRKELKYRNDSRLGLVSASVIAKDPTNFTQAITLNIGNNEGIRVGDAVISQGIYVGKIISVESFTSKALLVTDPESKVDAQIASSGENGILRGSYGSGMLLDMVSQNARITKGDLIVTAGLTDQIPRGLVIGTVGELQSQKGDLLQRSTVVSATDLKNLIFVSVVKR